MAHEIPRLSQSTSKAHVQALHSELAHQLTSNHSRPTSPRQLRPVDPSLSVHACMSQVLHAQICTYSFTGYLVRGMTLAASFFPKALDALALGGRKCNFGEGLWESDASFLRELLSRGLLRVVADFMRAPNGLCVPMPMLLPCLWALAHAGADVGFAVVLVQRFR